MSFYLILDSDFAARGQNVAIVASDPSLPPLIQRQSYMPNQRTSILTQGLSFTFVMSHDLNDIVAPGNPLVPAAIYSA
ncbi:hypothetical protein [Paraburkholderia bryophila]|uniref:Uncharacterized protein n=1 Tax=Paraburkholderia bryophila TaxID=420952 RepID=A0A329CVY2_9BURK|nr:hypothetical protein [Paraburkholderia bryophila]RAS38297.1 hypothetical protein BX591_102593 [Paraburkholderia bryophila]